jgi:hypothetical protein
LSGVELPGCRGAGGPWKIQFLRNILRSSRAGIAFISETKSSANKSANLLTLVHDFSVYVVPSTGLSGGLWLLWSHDVDLQIIESSRYYIFAIIKDSDQTRWVLGVIYGDASHKENRPLWNKIQQYANDPSYPFRCLGDFNAISNPSEKFGGSPTLNSNNRAFRDMLLQADLVDLGYSGPAFTWTNSQYTSNPIYQRLDRVLVSCSWQAKYPKAHVNHLPMIYSDHAPILLRMASPTQKYKDFRIEHWWLHLPGFDNECKRIWGSNINC